MQVELRDNHHGERDGGGSAARHRKDLTDRIRRRSEALGLDLFGVCAAGSVDGYAQYEAWVHQGMAGEMGYLTQNPERRSNPAQVLPGCRSVVVAGLLYAPASESIDQDAECELPGIIARYAVGEDYHELLKARLTALLGAIEEEAGAPVAARVYVDTGPLLERDLAYAAGLGWRARNSCLIHPEKGSYFFLGEILLDLDLEPSERRPFRCGTCHRCIEACPTGALLGDGVLDARRCISYLTIELKGPIPRELRRLIGNRVFGCDICQEVCPWNAHAPASAEPGFQPRPGMAPVELGELLGLTQEAFSARFRGSAIKRAKRRGLLRNAAVALGNSGDRRAIPPLLQALEDPEPLVRGHAAWALGRLEGPVARQALMQRAGVEDDGWVQEEITLAMDDAG